MHRSKRPHHNLTRLPITLMLVAMLIVGFVWAGNPVAAHGGNHGTIKVHDNEVADPPQRNEPHVDCDFWIEGFNMHDDAGTLVVYSWPPTGDKTEVLTDNWTGLLEEDGDGHEFLSGPYTLPDGHYRVEAWAEDGHPGGHPHFAKAKMFWVECEEAGPEVCPPTDLQATALTGGDVRLDFTVPDDATGTNIYRAVGDGDFEYVTTLGPDETSWVDNMTDIGVTYAYTVHPLFGDVEAEGCEVVEVTAIPVFPTVMALGLAVLLGVGAYGTLRLRRSS